MINVSGPRKEPCGMPALIGNEGRCRSNQFCGQNLPPIHTFLAHKALARAATLAHDKKGAGEQIT